jgi:outer membrane receptor protein involved in Fe transport
MKLDFRQRLLTTTILVGASILASPALAQNTEQAKPLCPPGAPPPGSNCTPQDSPTAPQADTTAPLAGQTAVPSTNAQGAPVTTSQEIVVTGSRIPQPNLTSASPVTVVSSQEVKLEGTTRTEDLINSLPQAFATMGSNISNGSTGIASVNLRGLGDKRTLVLVNGRRLQPGDPRAPVADINFIPSALIKRVDVLTGGASSVYGADAVAGVVNFIMDTDYRGLRIDAQASTFMHDNRAGNEIIGPNEALGYRPPHGMSVNGGAQDISGSFGAGFDDGRGSILAYATYRNQDPILESSRDYSFCSLGSFQPQYVAQYGEFYCGGSSTSATGTFNLFNPFTGKRVGRFHVEGNQFLPGATLFNFAPYNYFQRPDERYTFGAFANYEISEGAKPYLEAMFMNDHSFAQIAPSGDFSNTTAINCDNPLLSPQEFQAICGDPSILTTNPLSGAEQAFVTIGRRNVEGGGRLDDLEHTAFRIVAGMRGNLLRGLSYDAYYQFGTTRLSETFYNDFSITRLTRALDVVTDPATGQPVCRSVLLGIDPNCVPYNIFQTGGVTQAALNYLETPGFQRGNVNETIADANLTLEGGEYGLQTPWSDRGIGLNVGGEYRKELLSTNVDTEFSSGDLAGSGGATPSISGQFDVRELFGELELPIVSHSFIDEFTLRGGYRYSAYQVAANHFTTSTYKIEGELAPVHDVKLRASYNRAVRAPNVVELFTPQTPGLAGNVDPCAGENPIATAAQCANTGVSAAQYGNILDNPAHQYNALFGGNPDLKPETANTYTAGVVIQPRWIPGLAITADYFNIKIRDLIGTLGFQSIMNSCLNSGLLCDLIHRDQFGTLWLTTQGRVTLTNVNVGGLQTKGVDVQGSYSHRIGPGTLNISLVGTYLQHLITDTGVNPGNGLDGVFDCVSFYGATCGTPNPKWRHKLRVGFTLANGLGISGQWRYFSSVRADTLSSDPDLNGGGGPFANPGDAKLAAQSYFDLTLTARIANRFNARLGANNIFDSQPPVASGNTIGPPFGNGNTFPQVYDALGRFVFAGVTVDF